ncbi:MAG: FAD-binding oxidoreductase [Chloroflexi bacterium]|nr:FAD-binding oxidoreductase [Chloroflexota bacterium]
MTKRPDVVIAGGGMIGCVTAYFLGQQGLSSVVVERDAPGRQSGEADAGWLTPTAGSPLPESLARFCLYGLRLHRELAQRLPAESGLSYGFATMPVLWPALTEEEETRLRTAHAPWQAEHDLGVSWLEGDSARRLCPWLPSAVRFAVLSTGQAQLDPQQFTLAVLRAAERRGASLHSGTVTGIASEGHRARGITLADGTLLEADSVVLALGAWTSHAGEWLGISLPVEPVRGELIKFAPPVPTPECGMFHGGGFVLPKPAGYVAGGTTVERAGFARQVTPEGQRRIMGIVTRMAPVLERAKVLERTAGLRPFTPDRLPIIGRSPGWDNVYIASGHSTKGTVLSAATGKLLAQLIATGQADHDLTPFRLERFVG